MRQQENKKENFRENPTKLTWIPKVYNYAERTGNLKAEAVGVVSGEKHFPVFEDRMVFKPLTKSKPFSTPLFACAEVFWSWVIDTYFVPAPLYQLAFCRGYEAECEKYYDYGTVSPMIYEEGEHLLNLLEFFRTYPDEKVQIDDYLNYCQMFYDYTEILEADYFQTHRGIAEDLAMQILISVLKGDQNYHYENIAFVCDASGQILRLAPMIDHEFSTCFMFPDNLSRHNYWFGELQRSIEGKPVQPDEYKDFPNEKRTQTDGKKCDLPASESRLYQRTLSGSDGLVSGKRKQTETRSFAEKRELFYPKSKRLSGSCKFRRLSDRKSQIQRSR